MKQFNSSAWAYWYSMLGGRQSPCSCCVKWREIDNSPRWTHNCWKEDFRFSQFFSLPLLGTERMKRIRGRRDHPPTLNPLQGPSEDNNDEQPASLLVVSFRYFASSTSPPPATLPMDHSMGPPRNEHSESAFPYLICVFWFDRKRDTSPTIWGDRQRFTCHERITR